jgi:hypothetical protein
MYFLDDAPRELEHESHVSHGRPRELFLQRIVTAQ